jgi:hypothetical protein
MGMVSSAEVPGRTKELEVSRKGFLRSAVGWETDPACLFKCTDLVGVIC